MNDEFPSREFRDALATQPMSQWIRNVKTTLEWERLGRAHVPVSINESELDSSYVVSPYTALVLYSRQELVKLPRVFKALEILLTPLGVFLRTLRINQAVSVNNWLLSTNLFPEVEDEAFCELAGRKAKDHPDSFVIVRSLNEMTNARLMKSLRAAGFAFIPSRRVYCFDCRNRYPDVRHNRRIDRKLLQKSAFAMVTGAGFSTADFERAAHLYDLLYLEKYSVHNPAFTAAYLELCHRTRTMTFFGLRDAEGILQGVLGLFVLAGTVTAPIVGYNTALEPSLGLYRQLMALSLKVSEEHGWFLNLSSGAPHFKRLRGGVPVTEYSAVHIAHLSWWRRLGFRVLQALLYGLALPLLKIFKL